MENIGPKGSQVDDKTPFTPLLSRPIGEKLSSPPKDSYVYSKPVISSFIDFIKKNIARGLWGLGFGTASLSVLSYFLIGSKLLSLFFGVPTLMSFFIAHNLGQNLASGKNNLFQNPLDQLKAYIKDPSRIDTEIINTLRCVDELKDKLQKNPLNSQDILQALKSFKKIIEMKALMFNSADDPLTIRMKQDTERLLNALDPQFIPGL